MIPFPGEVSGIFIDTDFGEQHVMSHRHTTIRLLVKVLLVFLYLKKIRYGCSYERELDMQRIALSLSPSSGHESSFKEKGPLLSLAFSRRQTFQLAIRGKL